MPCSLRLGQSKYALYLFALFILLKLALEYSYVTYLSSGSPPDRFPVDFNGVKYIYGLFWFSILFWCIRHEKKVASTFLLQFFMVFQILPITIVYAMQNDSTVYYSFICIGTFICEWIVSHVKNIPCDVNFLHISQERWIISFFLISLFCFLVYVYYKNGLPTTMALDFSLVYKLRRSGIYQLDKYAGYFQTVLIKTVLPILLTSFFLQRKYTSLTCTIFVVLYMYLYTGEKFYFFLPLLVLGTTFFATKKNFSIRFWGCLVIIISIICVLVVPFQQFIEWPYNLFIRRIMFVSAQNSFSYYDFFSSNPLEGIAGIFPRWIIPVESNYGIDYPDGYIFQISRIYYNRPEMSSNNGFLSEGFLRFGLMGILLELLVFALILKLIDGFQEKTSFAFAIGCCIINIFGLGDGQLLRSIFFGHIGAWILFLLLYRPSSSDQRCKMDVLMSRNRERQL